MKLCLHVWEAWIDRVKLCVSVCVFEWLQLCTVDDNDCSPCVFCSSSCAGGIFLFLRDLCRICQLQSNFRLCVYFISILFFERRSSSIWSNYSIEFTWTSSSLFWVVKKMHLCLGKLVKLLAATDPRHLRSAMLSFRLSLWVQKLCICQVLDSHTGELRELHKLDIYNHNSGFRVQTLISFNEPCKQSHERFAYHHRNQKYPVNVSW